MVHSLEFCSTMLCLHTGRVPAVRPFLLIHSPRCAGTHPHSREGEEREGGEDGWEVLCRARLGWGVGKTTWVLIFSHFPTIRMWGYRGLGGLVSNLPSHSGGAIFVALSVSSIVGTPPPPSFFSRSDWRRILSALEIVSASGLAPHLVAG